MNLAARLQTLPPVTSPVFDRPFALSIGPQRAGTTWIDRYLRTRGDICMPADVKEIFYFDRNFGRGTDFYKSHFRPVPEHRLVMEISTTSFDTPMAAENVYSTFGRNIRLLCPLRHPVTRSYSLYQHYRRYGLVKGPLRESCEQNAQILESSHYAAHIERWLHVFGDNSIHFLFQEDMESNIPWFATQICNALQIPLMIPPADIRTRYNSCANSPWPGFARAAFDGASWLRRHKMYPVINAAKAIGLKKLILGIENNHTERPEIPLADLRWLQDKLNGQVETLEKLIGPISQWV